MSARPARGRSALLEDDLEARQAWAFDGGAGGGGTEEGRQTGGDGRRRPLEIRRLLHLDPVASIRVASVYREMKTLEAIGREAQGLLDQERVSQQGT